MSLAAALYSGFMFLQWPHPSRQKEYNEAARKHLKSCFVFNTRKVREKQNVYEVFFYPFYFLFRKPIKIFEFSKENKL